VPGDAIHEVYECLVAVGGLDVTAQDWTQVGAALGLHPGEALERVERFRQGLPDALADAAATAPGPFLKDAQRVATAVARQGHLKAVRLPRASDSQRR
jgi:serine/threonine-protein kinase HipA